MTGCGGDKRSTDEPKPSGRSLEYNDGNLAFISSEAPADTIAVLNIAIADDEEERNQGLMDVTSMPQSSGMLFIFPDAQPRSFWMANTPLPLDIIFVDADQTIINIHHQTKPYSQEQYASDQPAMFVVETNGGFCQSHDIREGMKIAF
jgi:uncharacterized membrane protein (UPF0127 family)